MALLGTGFCRRWRSVLLDPTWSESAIRGSRIVVECDDFALSEAAAHVLRGAGHEVAVCTGPDEHHRCPLVETGRCALVEGSRVVVNLLGFEDADSRDVLSHLRSRYPDIPVVAELPIAERETHSAEGVFVVGSPLRRDNLLTKVAAAESAGS
jgi:hypothetical protein